MASVIEKMPQQQVIQVRNVLFRYNDSPVESKTSLKDLYLSFPFISQASQGILDSSQSEAGEGRLVAALSRLHQLPFYLSGFQCWNLSLCVIDLLSLV